MEYVFDLRSMNTAVQFFTDILRKKQTVFIVLPLLFLFVTAFIKWFRFPSIDTLLYAFGGIIGIFFLDIAEELFHVSPSPFRSILFFALFICVSFFIITSSGSALASGLVLSLYLTLLLWQIGEWRVTGATESWYRMVAVSVPVASQRWIYGVSWALFVVLTGLFIR